MAPHLFSPRALGRSRVSLTQPCLSNQNLSIRRMDHRTPATMTFGTPTPTCQRAVRSLQPARTKTGRSARRCELMFLELLRRTDARSPLTRTPSTERTQAPIFISSLPYFPGRAKD
ncbi:hypothetical protein SCHPADRAFT_487012 [Schizopora paradoxa]|uniref:Uncharacterized protein n=1 Tax=Schizopora paradoxa TaxID=27342 RepID=A0A0H2RGZ1_9AGAM|nr:hypothetical protein SCHPADRAFT_487012 [Schizopora paradoxa]